MLKTKAQNLKSLSHRNLWQVELIFSSNEIELKIKKNFYNPVNAISDFILEQSA